MYRRRLLALLDEMDREDPIAPEDYAKGMRLWQRIDSASTPEPSPRFAQKARPVRAAIREALANGVDVIVPTVVLAESTTGDGASFRSTISSCAEVGCSAENVPVRHAQRSRRDRRAGSVR